MRPIKRKVSEAGEDTPVKKMKQEEKQEANYFPTELQCLVADENEATDRDSIYALNMVMQSSRALRESYTKSPNKKLFLDGMNGFGRIFTQLWHIYFDDAWSGVRKVSENVPEAGLRKLSRKSGTNIRDKLGISACHSLNHHNLPFLSNDRKDETIDKILGLDTPQKSRVLIGYAQKLKFFNETQIIRLVDAASNLLKSQIYNGLSESASCTNAIAFIHAVDQFCHTLRQGQSQPSTPNYDELQKHVGDIKNHNFKNEEIQGRLKNPRNNTAPVVGGRIVQRDIQDAVRAIESADNANAVRLFTETLNTALSHTSRNIISYNSDLRHVLEAAEPLMERLHDNRFVTKKSEGRPPHTVIENSRGDSFGL